MKTAFNESFVSAKIHPAYWQQDAANGAEDEASGLADRYETLKGFMLWLTVGKTQTQISQTALIVAWMMDAGHSRCTQRELAKRMGLDPGNLSRKIKDIESFMLQRRN